MTHPSEPDLITRASFARLVTVHCRLSGHDPEDRHLDNWLAAAWPMVVEDMDPRRWARAYLLAVGLAVPGTETRTAARPVRGKP